MKQFLKIFLFEPKQTKTQSVSVCFTKTKNIFFGLFRCFGPVLKQTKQTEFCQNKPKQTEKISKKHSLLGGPQNRKFFFRLEPKQTKTQSVMVVFRFAFLRNQLIFLRFVSVCFYVSDRYRNNQNKQNL